MIGLRVLSVMAAWVGGWLLSRSVPAWNIDYQNENALDNLIDGSLVDSAYDSTEPRPWDPLIAFFNGAWGAGIFFVIAVGMGIYGWGEQAVLSLEHFYKYYGLDIFITRGFLLSIAGLAMGYLPGVLTDKGPVGPLE